MISPIAKLKRTKIARVLLDSGSDRGKVKRLIKYPDLQSIKIQAESTGSAFSIKLRDSDNLFNASNDIGAEIPARSARIDPSKESSRIEISLTQSGAAWTSGDLLIESRFNDGSTVRKIIAPAKSGDGTGPTIPLDLSDNIPAPLGWPKL